VSHFLSQAYRVDPMAISQIDCIFQCCLFFISISNTFGGFHTMAVNHATAFSGCQWSKGLSRHLGWQFPLTGPHRRIHEHVYVFCPAWWYACRHVQRVLSHSLQSCEKSDVSAFHCQKRDVQPQRLHHINCSQVKQHAPRQQLLAWWLIICVQTSFQLSALKLVRSCLSTGVKQKVVHENQLNQVRTLMKWNWIARVPSNFYMTAHGAKKTKVQ